LWPRFYFVAEATPDMEKREVTSQESLEPATCAMGHKAGAAPQPSYATSAAFEPPTCAQCHQKMAYERIGRRPQAGSRRFHLFRCGRCGLADILPVVA
jgi:hypothetical protein